MVVDELRQGARVYGETYPKLWAAHFGELHLEELHQDYIQYPEHDRPPIETADKNRLGADERGR